MNDHVAASQRLVSGRPIVCLQSPSWVTELLCLLAVVELIALLMAVGEVSLARTQAANAREISEYWMEMALAPETAPTVRLNAEGNGYRCSTYNLRREWERAVGSKCDELGRLLIQARVGR